MLFGMWLSPEGSAGADPDLSANDGENQVPELPAGAAEYFTGLGVDLTALDEEARKPLLKVYEGRGKELAKFNDDAKARKAAEKRAAAAEAKLTALAESEYLEGEPTVDKIKALFDELQASKAGNAKLLARLAELADVFSPEMVELITGDASDLQFGKRVGEIKATIGENGTQSLIERLAREAGIGDGGSPNPHNPPGEDPAETKKRMLLEGVRGPQTAHQKLADDWLNQPAQARR